MSSLRSKINTKFKKQEEEYGTTFDESSIRINVVGGQTQLCPIKLNCSWVNPGRGPKIPELKCKWFKKTTNSFDEIADVTGTYYQPCLQDVGTMYIDTYSEFIYNASQSLKDVNTKECPLARMLDRLSLTLKPKKKGMTYLRQKRRVFS